MTKQSKTVQKQIGPKPLTHLSPLSINRFEIIQGKINYKDFSIKHQIDIFIESLNLLATNLSNVETSDNPLPSTLKAKGISLRESTFNVDASLNVLNQIPDLDLKVEFEYVNMLALNDLQKQMQILVMKKVFKRSICNKSA